MLYYEHTELIIEYCFLIDRPGICITNRLYIFSG